MARTRDTSQQGRHIALVLLDGACERAMALALRASGRPIGRKQKFPDLYAGVVELYGHDWVSGSWTGVQALHQMRNQAQHVAGIADTDQIRGWAADATRFVSGIVEEAFGVALATITRAEAIEDGAIRELLLQAEQALHREDIEQAVTSSREAFAIAKEQWRQQASLGRVGTAGFYGGGIYDDEARRAAAQVREWIVVSALAIDPTEHVWYQGLLDAVNSGVSVERAEASRALAFVFDWVARWEAFRSRHDPDRIERQLSTRRPPVLDEVDGVHVLPGTVSVHEKPTSTSGRTAEYRTQLSVQIVNVETQDAQEWANDVAESIRRLAGETGTAGSGWRVQVEPTGEVTFHVDGLEPDVSLLVGSVRRAIQEAEAAQRERELRRERWSIEEAELIERYRPVIAEIEPPPGVEFGALTAHPEPTWPEEPDACWITLPIEESHSSRPFSFRIAYHNLAMETEDGSGFRSAEGVAWRPSIEPAQVAEQLRVVATSVSEALEKHRREQKRLDYARERIALAMRRQLGQP